MTSSPPYVGVTGITTAEETKSVLDIMSSVGYSVLTPHMGMLGYLVSLKTLTNQQVENRRYPAFKDLVSLLKPIRPGQISSAMSMIHYNSIEQSTLADQLTKVFDNLYDLDLCKALQLNIPWPDTQQVAIFRKKFPQTEIVLQLSNSSLRDLTLQELPKKLNEYGKSIDYVLIDSSGGRGKKFDLNYSVNIYNEIKEKIPRLTIGFAGGLNPKNVTGIAGDIIGKIDEDDFCIDTEKGVRDKVTDDYGDDVLNLNKVKKYLEESCTIIP